MARHARDFALLASLGSDYHGPDSPWAALGRLPALPPEARNATIAPAVNPYNWQEHLYEMDYLREGIGLRAMAQRNPLVEYQREGYDMFSLLVDSVKEDTLRYMYHVKVERQQAGLDGIVERAVEAEGLLVAHRVSSSRRRAVSRSRRLRTPDGLMPRAVGSQFPG